MMQQLEQSQILKVRDVIFRACGLWFNESKLPILSNRINTRLKESGISDLGKYLLVIASEDDRSELSTLINLVTTNETYFYRSNSQMDSFRKIILPEITDKKVAQNNRNLNIWSAGCSTGEEPYTLAICVLETLKFHSIWDIEILATDISTEVLARAFQGIYSKRSVENLPEEYLQKYFTPSDGNYAIRESIKKYVEFEYSNLTDSYFQKDFDIIFCRNVMIYFRDETKADILNRFYDSLKDGGYLFLGPTEMIRGLTDGFKMITLKDSVAFQKVPR